MLLMVRLVLFLAGAILVVSCVTLPDETANNGWDYNDAVGTVTFSTPLFVPIESAATGEGRLDFGTHKEVETLYKDILKAQGRITQLEYLALAAMFEGNFKPAPKTEQQGDDNAEPAPADEENGNESEERGQLDAPRYAKDGTDQTIFEKLLSKLIDQIGEADEKSPFTLPPDDMGTLVSGYRRFMQNIEEYHNLDGFRFAEGGDDGWVPYRVHFTVTANPGWYTRYWQYEAVGNISFGGAKLYDNKGKIKRIEDCDYRVVSAAPSETAQVLDQFNASYTSLLLSTAFSAMSGKGADVAGTTDLRKDFLQILEGRRVNKTLMLGFPRVDSVEVRFRPRFVPTQEAQDLQPTSRQITAVVLVRNKKEEQGLCEYLSRPERWQSYKDDHEIMKNIAELPDLVALIEKKQWLEQTLKDDASAKAWLDKLDDEIEESARKFSDAENISPRDAKGIAEAIVAKNLDNHSRDILRIFEPRDCAIQTCYHFATAVRDDAGDWHPPRNLGVAHSRPVERLPENFEATERDAKAVVSPWYGPLATPFDVVVREVAKRDPVSNEPLPPDQRWGPGGTYWFHGGDIAALDVQLQELVKLAAKTETDRKKELESKQKAESATDKAAKRVKEAAEFFTRILSEFTKVLPCDPITSGVLRTRLKEAKVELDKAKQDKLKAEEAATEASTRVKKLASELKNLIGQISEANSEIQKQLAELWSKARAVIQFEITSPAHTLGDPKEHYTPLDLKKTEVWGRVVGPDGCCEDGGSFRHLGTGSIEGHLVFELDARTAIAGPDGKLESGDTPRRIRVHIEFILVEFPPSKEGTCVIQEARDGRLSAGVGCTIVNRVTSYADLELRERGLPSATTPKTPELKKEESKLEESKKTITETKVTQTEMVKPAAPGEGN